MLNLDIIFVTYANKWISKSYIMKTKLFFSFPLSFILLVLIYGFGGGSKWPGGSPGGYTGSPGDGKDCTQCHGGTASTVLGWISSNIPDEGYIPGDTYIINIHITGSGDKGFEVSPQDLGGNLIGSLTAGTNNHLVASNTAVTQDDATSLNPAQWEFEWTAPQAGTGDVTFYGAFTVNKPVTKLSTYIAHENTTISIEEHAEMQLTVYPNPAKDVINIDFQAKETAKLSIDLVSMSGRSILIHEDAKVQKGDHSIRCLLPSDLQAGSYILHIQHNTQVSNIKIIIK